MYHSLASASGLDAELARDGYEAILLGQLARPDAIVLDVCEGHLDGAWILARIRANVGTRTRPVIFVGPPLAASAEVDPPLFTVQANDPFEVLRVVERVLETSCEANAIG
jgi:response regulator RpfG family c-di-GMP phosphodiesterase